MLSSLSIKYTPHSSQRIMLALRVQMRSLVPLSQLTEHHKYEPTRMSEPS